MMKSSSAPALSRWAPAAGGMALALLAGVFIGRSTSSSHGSLASSSGNGSDGGRGGSGSASMSPSARRKAAAEARSASHQSLADLQNILDNTSRLDRTQKLLSLIDHLPTGEFEQLYGSVRDMPGANLHGSERSLILQAWAERDPIAATSFLQTKGANDWERETAVGAWASKDPEAAFTWALNAPDEGKVNNWQLGAARGIAAANPELARDYLMQMDGETRDRSLGAIQPYVMQYGFDYATGWLDGIGDDATRTRADAMMAKDLASLDPAKAAQWDSYITDPKTRSEAAKTIADAWASTDVDAAKAWVASLPENAMTQAAEGVARHYAQENPQAAAAWLSGLGSDPNLDGARRIVVEQTYNASPQTSLDLVSQISDAKTRDGYYWKEVNRWMKDDSASARSWIARNSNVLPQQLVQRLNQ